MRRKTHQWKRQIFLKNLEQNHQCQDKIRPPWWQALSSECVSLFFTNFPEDWTVQ
ncbi:hypothetical protein Ancab_004666, partial [Ancistrocladus abbreviatus]